jgi:hypothetical protein
MGVPKRSCAILKPSLIQMNIMRYDQRCQLDNESLISNNSSVGWQADILSTISSFCAQKLLK